MRLIVAVKPAVAAAANTAANQSDTDPAGGDKTFTATLRLIGDVTNTVRAYWCSWEMTAAKATALRTRLQEQGFSVGETSVVSIAEKLTFVANPLAKGYVFRGESVNGDGGWTPQEVLTALGLERIP